MCSSDLGHHLMGAVLGGVLLVTMLACWRGTAAARFETQPSVGGDALADLTASLRNRPFVLLLASLCVQMVGIGQLLAAVPYYATWLLRGDQGTVTLLFLCLVGPAAVTVPLWLALNRRQGPVVAYLTSLALLGVAAALLGLLGHAATLPLAAPIVALLGVGYAGSQLFPFALLPTTQRAETSDQGIHREGAMTGVWLLGDQAALALGAFLAGVHLSLTGYREGGVQQAPEALDGILWAMSWTPAALFVAAFALATRLRP